MTKQELTEEIVRVTDLIYQNKKDIQTEVAGLLNNMMPIVEEMEAETSADGVCFLQSMGDALDAMQRNDMVLLADILIFRITPLLRG